MTIQDYKNATAELKEFSSWAKHQIDPDYSNRVMGAILKFMGSVAELVNDLKKPSKPRAKQGGITYYP
jgi:hypothetical protein